MLILLRQFLFVPDEFVASGKHIYGRLIDVSPPKQMFHVNLFRCVPVGRSPVLQELRSLVLLFGKCRPDAGSLSAPMFHGCQSQRWS